MLLSSKEGRWDNSVATAYRSRAGFKAIFKSVLELTVVETVGMILL